MVEVQNQHPFPLFLGEVGKELRFGDIAEVAEEVAAELKKVGVWTVGEDVVHDVEQLKAASPSQVVEDVVQDVEQIVHDVEHPAPAAADETPALSVEGASDKA